MAVQSVEAVIQNSMAAEAAVAWYQSRLGFVCSASDVLTGPELATLFQWPESTRLQRWILRLGEETLQIWGCLLYTSPSPRDLSTSRMPSSA